VKPSFPALPTPGGSVRGKDRREKINSYEPCLNNVFVLGVGADGILAKRTLKIKLTDREIDEIKEMRKSIE
jgi:hypothetical protein